MKLPAYKITTQSGYTWTTSMSTGTTLDKAKEYFIGKFFNVAAYPAEHMEQAICVKSA